MVKKDLSAWSGEARTCGYSGPAVYALVVCALSFGTYAAIGLAAHRAFHTNGYDLSVFDYALWTTVRFSRIAYVPLFGHSLFAQHFMPTLLVLAPLSAIFSSPEYLIVTQAALFAAAGFALFQCARLKVPWPEALALCIAFLLSRRSFSAANSYFYIECAEPLLAFGLVWSLWTRRTRRYSVLLLLLLGCKEDVGIYTACFGALVATDRTTRRIGLWTFTVSVAWVAAALLWAIPTFRALDGLQGSNAFLQGYYGTQGMFDVSLILRRCLTFHTLTNLTAVFSATGFAALADPVWLLVAGPGLILNLAAPPGLPQSGLIGHYLWPLLPWLFVAAIGGLRRMPPAVRRWSPMVLVIIALSDTPVPRVAATVRWRRPADAARLSESLRQVPPTASVTAQPNLLPHLPRRLNIATLGVNEPSRLTSEYVLLTTIGDLWPFAIGDISERAAELVDSRRYVSSVGGPAYVFRRVPEPKSNAFLSSIPAVGAERASMAPSVLTSQKWVTVSQQPIMMSWRVVRAIASHEDGLCERSALAPPREGVPHPPAQQCVTSCGHVAVSLSSRDNEFGNAL